MDEFFFMILPYVALTLFIAVPIIRRKFGGYRFSTRASGFFERDSMTIASAAIHWGVFILFAAHICGLIGGLITSAGWVDVFRWAGLVGGVVLLYGLIMALVRRIVIREMRATSQVDDYAIPGLLIFIIVVALWASVVDKSFGQSHVVAGWFGGIFTGSPEVGPMAGLPILNQMHIIAAMVFVAYFPFTKMVHMWTLPLSYFRRPYQSMRSYRKVMS